MKDIRQVVESVAASAGKKSHVQEAVNQILGEDIKAGQTVAIVDDPIFGFSGGKAKVKSINDNNPGFAECELENGTVLKLQTSLLVPV